MPTDMTTDVHVRAALDALACRQRRDLCGQCGGSPSDPCGRCARQRERLVQLYEADAPLALMAATLGLPVWRVEQLLEEERARAQGDVDERALNAELLRPELGGLVDVILAGPDPAPGRGWRFERRSQWHRSVALSLDLVGWHIQAVNTVLNGTHIPNAPLRERFVQIRAASGGRLSSELLARRAGVTDGTYLDRLLGLRPVSRHRRHGRVYGGRVLKAISVERAARIADALGVPHYEIPGL